MLKVQRTIGHAADFSQDKERITQNEGPFQPFQ